MASPLLGSNPEHLLQLAQSVSTAATKMAQRRADIGKRAQSPAVWVGADADAFRSGPWAAVSKRADALVTQLQATKTLLESNAAAQTKVSGT